MKRLVRIWLAFALVVVESAIAEQRAIVRVTGGGSTLSGACGLLGCNIIRGLEDPFGQLFLIGVPDATSLTSLLRSLSALPGILNAEADVVVRVAQNRPPVPPALYDTASVLYFGVQVRSGYVSQPARNIVRLADAQNTFGLSGNSTVAVIDTGVDAGHPALQRVLAAGYDFTRNQPHGSETGDVTQSTVAVVDGVGPAYVNNYTAASVDQSTAAVVDTREYSAFGHGTMVAGIVHLVAPNATILPLKSFGPDGSGYVSDILRAVYVAVRSKARVINMSFGIATSSNELSKSISYATASGVVCVASAGNNGAAAPVYPAAYSNVIGVASTTNEDVRSSFSNYGTPLVWLAAPGEGVVTTYPFRNVCRGLGDIFQRTFGGRDGSLAVGGE